MNTERIDIAFAKPDELVEIGRLMAEEYSRLNGFPSEADQPSYYEQFYKLRELTESATTDVIVAKDHLNQIVGGVVYYSDMKSYGAGGKATTSIKNAAGIRLLVVSSDVQGQGIGRKITEHCIGLARTSGRSKLILHTTRFMPAAWNLYEHMNFQRYPGIDFMQADLEVFGFQLSIKKSE